MRAFWGATISFFLAGALQLVSLGVNFKVGVFLVGFWSTV